MDAVPVSQVIDPKGISETSSTEWIKDLKNSSERLTINHIFRNISDAYGLHRHNIDELIRNTDKSDLLVFEAEGYLSKIMTLMRQKIALDGLAIPTARFSPKDGSILVDWSWRHGNWLDGHEPLDLTRVLWEIIVSSDKAAVPDNDMLDASHVDGYACSPGTDRENTTIHVGLVDQTEIFAWVRVRYRHTYDWGDQIFISEFWCPAHLQVLDSEAVTRFVQAFTLTGPPSVRLQGPYISVDWTNVVPLGPKASDFILYGDFRWKLELNEGPGEATQKISWDAPGNVTWYQHKAVPIEGFSEVQISIQAKVETGLPGEPEICSPKTLVLVTRTAPGTTLGPGQSLGRGEFLQLIVEEGALEIRLSLEEDGSMTLCHITPQFKRTVFTARAQDGSKRGTVARMTMQPDGALTAPWPSFNEFWRIEPKDGKKQPGSSVCIRPDGTMAIVSPEGQDLWVAGGPLLRDPTRLDCVQVGEALWAGQKLVSPNSRYSLVLQSDQNLVLFDGTKVIWNNKGNFGPRLGVERLVVQVDDNIIVYAPNHVLWSTDTRRRNKGGKGSLVLRDDGKLVFQSDGTILWSNDASLVQLYEPVELVAVPAGSDRLEIGQYLGKSASLVSKNEAAYVLTLRPNGSLALSPSSHPDAVLWSTTASDVVSRLCFAEFPPRLGVWGRDGHVKWEPTLWPNRRPQVDSNTIFVLREDGDIMLSVMKLTGQTKLWSSETSFTARISPVSSIGVGQGLFADQRLVSSNGLYIMSMTPQGGFSIMYTADTSHAVSTNPLYEVTNLDEAAFSIRITSDGSLRVFDRSGTQRWSHDRNAESLRLTDNGELFVFERSNLVIRALHPYILPSLRTGQSMYPYQRIRSLDASYELVLQNDGNLVLYHITPKNAGNSTARWSTDTVHRGNTTIMDLQADGNLVLYELSWSGRTARWNSDTADNSNSGRLRELTVTNDGDILLLEEGKVIKSLR